MNQANEPICRLCHSKIIKNILHLPTVPRNVLSMHDDHNSELSKDSAISIRVLECQDCGLVQISQVLEDYHYVDSFWSASHIKQMVSHQKQQAEQFVFRCGL